MKYTDIPFWTYLKEYHQERKHILHLIDKVLSRGQLILGHEVEMFEKESARFCGVRFAVGVGNGTDALFLSLKALGIGPGDEVITVPNTAIPTVSAICATGAKPVFVDVHDDTLLMDENNIVKRISNHTKCIVPVHLYGQCCNMTAINEIAKKYHLFVLEDCAQALGAQWNDKVAGSMSDIAAFSFYPTKIIGAYGDAGAVVTNSRVLADKVRSLRMYGTTGKYYSYIQGYNSRLDELQAAILRWKLRHVESAIKKRQRIAQRYKGSRFDKKRDSRASPKNISPSKQVLFTVPTVDPSASHVFHLFVVRHPRRDKFIQRLKHLGIATAIHYPHPIHLMPAYKFLGNKRGDFPVAEKACSEVISLPLYPQLSTKEQDKIIDALKESLTSS